MGYVETALRVNGDPTGTQIARVTQRESAADRWSDGETSPLSDVCGELAEPDSSGDPRAPETTDSFEWRASARVESDREESSFFSIVVASLFIFLLLGACALLHRLRPRERERAAG